MSIHMAILYEFAVFTPKVKIKCLALRTKAEVGERGGEDFAIISRLTLKAISKARNRVFAAEAFLTGATTFVRAAFASPTFRPFN